MKTFFACFLIALLIFDTIRFGINYFSYNRLKNKYGEIKIDIADFELPEEEFYIKRITAEDILVAKQNKFNSAILYLILIIITMLALISWFI